MNHRVWAEVDLDRIGHNLAQIRRRVGPSVTVIGVVKADAYGHGAVPFARELQRLGVGMLGVATPQEATELREAAIGGSILILGATLPSDADVVLRTKAAVTISDIGVAEAFSKEAQSVGVTIPVHLKVDTGMGRLGVPAAEAVESAMRLTRMRGLRVEGILMHFASADSDRQFTESQISLFEGICSQIRSRGISMAMRHAANSAGIIAHPTSFFDAVRPGTSLYGYYPWPGMVQTLDLKPVLTMKSRIVFLKRFQPGQTTGYGRTCRVEKEALGAVVSVGYADGFSRLLSNRGHVLIAGKRVKVLGRISMDQTVVDVTGLPDVKVDDEVVIYGRQADEQLWVDEVAQFLGTIPNELLCAIGRRVPRIYLRGGQPV